MYQSFSPFMVEVRGISSRASTALGQAALTDPESLHSRSMMLLLAVSHAPPDCFRHWRRQASVPLARHSLPPYSHPPAPLWETKKASLKTSLFCLTNPVDFDTRDGCTRLRKAGAFCTPKIVLGMGYTSLHGSAACRIWLFIQELSLRHLW